MFWREAEKQAFQAAAELDGKKLSEWIRDRLRRLSREELQANGLDVPFLSFCLDIVDTECKLEMRHGKR
jgi:hypothetical protein